MAVAQDILLYPLRYAVATRTLRVTLNSQPQDLAIAAMVADRNYWASFDGQNDASTNGGIGDLIDILKDALDTHDEADGTSNSSVWAVDDTSNDKSNQLKITNDTYDFSIDWTHGNTTADAKTFGTDLGFDTTSDDSSTAQGFTVTNRTKGIWFPGKPRSLDSRDRQGYVGSTARTISGLQRTTRLAVPKKTRELEWSLLNKAKALDEYAASTETTGAFESAFDDAISLGRRFRAYDDTTSRTSSSYTLYRSTSLADPLSRDPREFTRWQDKLSCVRGD